MGAASRARARAIRTTLGAGALAALCLATPAAARGQSSGGTSSTPVPEIASVWCPTGCDDLEPGRPGDLLRITGRHLDTVTSVVFLGAGGRPDDVSARPRRGAPRRLEVVIPRRARSGAVQLVGADAAASRPSRGTVALGTRGATGEPREISAGPLVARLSTRTMLFGGHRPAELTYTVQGAEPLPVRVDLVRASDGGVAATWNAGAVAPGAPQTVSWNGLAGGRVPADGRYEFRLYAGAQPAAPQAATATLSDSFLFLSHVFPIRGRHDYGTTVNRFGAASGRGHRGHDVLCACGLPLVAARGGVVKWKGFQGAAGNYVVIDGAGTGYDYAYMHLREPAVVERGQRVATGQLIGHAGMTGNATTCHLHFELWEGAWWGGGHPVDPLPHLRAWDRATALALASAR